MHAIVVRVDINEREAAEKMLREEVVPRVSGAPGFVAGYWTRGEDGGGMSMIVFESEDAAKTVAGGIEQIVSDAVTLKGVEIREVVASA